MTNEFLVNILSTKNSHIPIGQWLLTKDTFKYVTKETEILFNLDMISSVKKIENIGKNTVFEMTLTNNSILTISAENSTFSTLFEYQFKSKKLEFKLTEQKKIKKLTLGTVLLYVIIISILAAIILPATHQNSTSGNIVNVNKKDSVDYAFDLCEALDATNELSSKCKVNGRKIEISADTTTPNAKLLCSSVQSLVIKNGAIFEQGWLLKIYSPLSGDKTIAECSIANKPFPDTSKRIIKNNAVKNVVEYSTSPAYPTNAESIVKKNQKPIIINNEIAQSKLCKAAISSSIDFDIKDSKSIQINPLSAIVTWHDSDNENWKFLCKVIGNNIIYASMNEDGPQTIKISRWRLHPSDEKITYQIDNSNLIITLKYSQGETIEKKFKIKEL